MSADKRKSPSGKSEEESVKKLKLDDGSATQTSADDPRMKLIEILDREIETEINSLKDDLETIEDRIYQTKQYLMKVRQGIVSEFYQQTNKSILQRPLHPAVRKVLRGKTPRSSEDNAELSQFSEDSKNTNSPFSEFSKDTVSEGNSSEEQNNSYWLHSKSSSNELVGGSETILPGSVQKAEESGNESDKIENQNIKIPRYIPPKILEKSISKLCQLRENTKKQKIRIVIGNVSKWLSEQCQNATHKWTVYIKSLDPDLDISALITKVKFFLHPSYKPNDVVQVERPPFKLTRRGWGEFPLRVQLHFINNFNKPIDLIHQLKLDQTRSGMETFGCETVADLWLHLEEKSHNVGAEQFLQILSKSESNDIYSSLSAPAQTVETKSLFSENGISVKQEPINSTLEKNNFINFSSDSLDVTENNFSASEIKLEDGINDFDLPDNDKLSYLTDFTSVFMDDNCLKGLESMQLPGSDELALNNDTSSAIEALCSEVRFQDIHNSLTQMPAPDMNSENRFNIDTCTGSNGSLANVENDIASNFKSCDTEFKCSSDVLDNRIAESFNVIMDSSNKTENYNMTNVSSHLNPEFVFKPFAEVSLSDNSSVDVLKNDLNVDKLLKIETVTEEQPAANIKISKPEVQSPVDMPASNDAQIEHSKELKINFNTDKDVTNNKKLIFGRTQNEIKLCKTEIQVPPLIKNVSSSTNMVSLSANTNTNIVEKPGVSAKITAPNIKTTVPGRKLFLKLQNGQLKEINARVVVVPAKQQIMPVKLSQPATGKIISEGSIKNLTFGDVPIKSVDHGQTVTGTNQSVTNIIVPNQQVNINSPKEVIRSENSDLLKQSIVTVKASEHMKPIKPIVLKSVVPCALLKSSQTSNEVSIGKKSFIVRNGNKILTHQKSILNLTASSKVQGVTEINSLSPSTSSPLITTQFHNTAVLSKNLKQEPVLKNLQFGQRSKNMVLKNSSEIEITIQDDVKDILVKNVVNKCHRQKPIVNKCLSSVTDQCANNRTFQFPLSKTIVLPTSSSSENKTVVVQKKILPGMSLLKKSVVKPEGSKNGEDLVPHILVNKSNCNDLKNCPSQDIESAVSWLMKRFPVVDKRAKFEAFKTKHPYCAQDEDSFLRWPLPKQRAAEWLRAKTIGRLLPKICGSLKPWKIVEILKWARARGFTPVRIESNISPVYKPTVEFNYTPQPDIKDLLNKCRSLESEEYVDVENTDEEKVLTETSITLKDVIVKGGSFIPLEVQLRGIGSFIQQHCETIKCHLGGEEIVPGIFHPSSLRLMISVFSSFAEDLIRRSYEAAWNRYGERTPHIIEEIDVRSAVLSRSEFDLFTHEGEGAPFDSALLST